MFSFFTNVVNSENRKEPSKVLIFFKMLNKKPDKGDADSDDGGTFPLTPGTEANYKKIDEDYAKVMSQGRTGLLSVCL